MAMVMSLRCDRRSIARIGRRAYDADAIAAGRRDAGFRLVRC
jgi:hypothetical protein